VKGNKDLQLENPDEETAAISAYQRVSDTKGVTIDLSVAAKGRGSEVTVKIGCVGGIMTSKAAVASSTADFFKAAAKVGSSNRD
jgi:hypothetical protein